MDDQALALLRFDFVLGDEDEAVREELGRRFGEPVEESMWGDALDGGRGERTFDVDDPNELGLPPEFGAVTIRMAAFSDAVTGLITFAAVDGSRLSVAGAEGADGVESGPIREWERRLRTVRSLLPGEERGPETTVFWLESGSLPTDLEAHPSDPADGRPSESRDAIPDALDPFVERSGSGLFELEPETLLLPRDHGQLWGTLLAVDLDGHLRSTVASGGRRLRGPWTDLAALYGIHYWCRARGAELAAFEDRLAAAAAGLPAAGGDVDPGEFVAWDETVRALEEDWAALGHRVDEERRQLRRLRRDCSARLVGRSRRRRDARDDDAALLASYLEQLEGELEGVRSDARRLADRLDSLTAVLRTRVTLVAALATADLARRAGDGTGGRRLLDDRSSWFAAAVVALVVVLVADVLMTGGLETFVDRLFDRGLDAFTTQVVAGVALVGLALATVVLLRRRDDTRR